MAEYNSRSLQTHFSFRWSNLNISELKKFSKSKVSPLFPNGNSDLSWILKLSYEENIAENEECLSLYLALVSSKTFPVFARYKFTILNTDSQPIYSGIGEFTVIKENTCLRKWTGVEKFITDQHLLRLLQNLRVFDLLCEIATELDDITEKIEIDESISSMMKFSGCTPVENNERFKMDENFSDIVLCFCGKEFKVHKFVLTQSSPYFQNKLNNLSETESEGKLIIEDKDVDLETFQIILEYVYTGSVDVHHSKLLNLLYATDKYDIPSLKAFCATSLISNVSTNNAAHYFHFADINNIQVLRDAAFRYIRRNLADVSRTEFWRFLVNKRPDLVQECSVGISD